MWSGMHYALQSAGVKSTPPGGPPRDTVGCLLLLLCSQRLAMALWPYPVWEWNLTPAAKRLKHLGGSRGEKGIACTSKGSSSAAG